MSNSDIAALALTLETELRSNGITAHSVELGSELVAAKGTRGPLVGVLRVSLKTRRIGRKANRHAVEECRSVRLHFAA